MYILSLYKNHIMEMYTVNNIIDNIILPSLTLKLRGTIEEVNPLFSMIINI